MLGKGDAVGTLECPQCSAPITLKLNVNRIVYGSCKARPHAEHPFNCSFFVKYGRIDSNRMIADFAKSETTTHEETDDRPETGNGSAGSSPAKTGGDGIEHGDGDGGPVREPGSAITHFADFGRGTS